MGGQSPKIKKKEEEEGGEWRGNTGEGGQRSRISPRLPSGQVPFVNRQDCEC